MQKNYEDKWQNERLLAESFQKTNEKLKKEQSEILEQNAELNRKNIHLSQENSKLTQKIRHVEQQLNENANAFDKLSKDVKKEAIQIKTTSDEMVKNNRKEVERKFSAELGSTEQQLKKLTQMYIKQNQSWSEEIEKLQKLQEAELVKSTEIFDKISVKNHENLTKV